ncbi:MAG: class I SAM-dependent methyltransferase [Methanotrichaceae archaeon]|nr:class I SAM-dependent methyltransferase [Methanotrichaceae archaeon]
MKSMRETLSQKYIHGNGLEIGALHNPLTLPSDAKALYVDRLPVEALRKQYPELDAYRLVNTDIIDDGETLARISNSSQDFLIENHFLEHCQDPFRAVENAIRVLKPGGVYYVALPDKRFSFDKDRPLTSLHHLKMDYCKGPEISRLNHLNEWVRLVMKEENVPYHVNRLLEIGYSIHYHVWTYRQMVEMFSYLESLFEFKIEFSVFNDTEGLFILNKT